MREPLIEDFLETRDMDSRNQDALLFPYIKINVQGHRARISTGDPYVMNKSQQMIQSFALKRGIL